MVDTVYWLPTGGPVAQAGWLGPLKVGGHLAPCCIHRVNRVNSRNGSVFLMSSSSQKHSRRGPYRHPE